MANLCARHRCARERGAPGRCPALFLGRSDGLGSRFGGLPGSGAAWAPPVRRLKGLAEPLSLEVSGFFVGPVYTASRESAQLRISRPKKASEVAARTGPGKTTHFEGETSQGQSPALGMLRIRGARAPRRPHAPHILRSAWLCGIGSTRTSQQTLHYANVYNQQRYGYKTETFVKFGVFFIG